MQIDEKAVDPKVLDVVAIAISGAPFVTKQSLRKARAAILAYESAKPKEAQPVQEVHTLNLKLGSRLTVEGVEAVGMPSEEEIYAALKPWTVTFSSAHRRRTARAILSLIRPAFEAQQAKLAQAVEALNTAAEDIEHWGSYASSYLQDKHGLKDDIAATRIASAVARGETR